MFSCIFLDEEVCENLCIAQLEHLAEAVAASCLTDKINRSLIPRFSSFLPLQSGSNTQIIGGSITAINDRKKKRRNKKAAERGNCVTEQRRPGAPRGVQLQPVTLEE
jgi:hypothetical protein